MSDHSDHFDDSGDEKTDSKTAQKAANDRLRTMLTGLPSPQKQIISESSNAVL